MIWRRFVYASSSSVYGDQDVYPAREDAPVRPISPYGATKVITEQLAGAFWRAAGVPVVGLRYFTVYGPRQRPDMAFSRLLSCALAGRPMPVLGDGRQVREFTYVADVVRATVAAAEDGERGSVYNVGGGRPVALLEVIALLEALLFRRPSVIIPRHGPSREQAIRAERFADWGIARILPARDADPCSLAGAIATALDSGTPPAAPVSLGGLDAAIEAFELAMAGIPAARRVVTSKPLW